MMGSYRIDRKVEDPMTRLTPIHAKDEKYSGNCGRCKALQGSDLRGGSMNRLQWYEGGRYC